jgi:DNA-directed RNA polymerase II subunit RPB2
MSFNWENDTFEVIKAYLNQKQHLINHQVEGYNQFVSINIQDVIEQFNPIRLHFDYEPILKEYLKGIKIYINNPGFDEPSIITASGCSKKIYPHDARIKKLTYSSNLIVDVYIETSVKKPKKDKKECRCFTKKTKVDKIQIGNIPVMLGSILCSTTSAYAAGLNAKDINECSVDPGGYFIVNGSEKVLVSIERPGENIIMVYPEANPPSADIKSIPSGKCVRPRPFQLKMARGHLGDDVIKVFIPQVRQNIPLWTVMHALGAESDKQIYNELLMGIMSPSVRMQADQLLKSSIRDSCANNTKEAIEYISRHVSSFGNMESEKTTNLTGALQYAHEKAKLAKNTVEENDAVLERASIDKEKRMTYTKVIIEREILPHVGNSTYKKRLFIGHIFRRLVYGVYTNAENDDRDSFINKRINSAGPLLTQLFSQNYTRLIREIKTSLNKAYSKGSWRTKGDFHSIANKDMIHRYIRSSILTKTIRAALSTGNLGAKGTTNLVGVAQVLNRLSFNGTLSHLRRVAAPLGNTGKLLKPRALHPTQIFTMCASESPEGATIGLVKNLALATTVSVYCSSEPSKKLLKQFGCIEIEDNVKITNEYGLVFVDGDLWGITDKPKYIISNMRESRRNGKLHPHISIYWDISKKTISTSSELGEIYITGTSGRLLRPMYILNNGKFVINNKHIKYLKQGCSFNSLLMPKMLNKDLKPAIEYIDVSESNTLLIAMNQKAINKLRNGIELNYTHCELHPSLMLGVLGASIPFPGNNQSPRNTYQSAMAKQSMGLYATNFNERFGTLAHLLNYPQTPMVYTRTHNILPTRKMPSGQTLIVAIATNGGYNQEDSVIMSKTAVDRGLMLSTMTKTYRGEEKTVEGTTHRDIFCIPKRENTIGTKTGAYNNLDEETGLAKVGSRVKNGDIIIGKVTPLAGKGSRCKVVNKYRDSSVVVRNCTGGIVDKTVVTDTEDGGRIAKIRVRSIREGSIGDKFSSRAAQKGIVGMIRHQSDMPFTTLGISPDIIMNPHAIPSRMTIGQLLESGLTKLCSILATNGDATPFTGMSPLHIEKFVKTLDIEEANGDEVLYDPRTGRPLKVRIFICPTYYQKLKHIARDKAHARSTGPMVEMTRQPTEGRARDGGLRLGEMERDCLAGHGMGLFLRESMLKRADDYATGFCHNCGMIAPFNPKVKIMECISCTRKIRDKGECAIFNKISKVHLPYASKLFIHELTSMGITIRQKV